MKTTEQRFFEKVEMIPFHTCWEWVGSKNVDGYGNFSIKHRFKATHRFSYEFHIGKIPPNMCVCYACDNRSCVNPAHLFLGSHTENMRDMIKKKRRFNFSGENHGMAKFTEKQIIEIRKNFKNKKGEKANLAREYGVSDTLMS